MCNHDKREEAKIFEDHAVGTYKDSRLVGHVPIELSVLFCKFIEKRSNQIFAERQKKTGKWFSCTMYFSCKWKQKAYWNTFVRDK